jgi:UDP-N-acetylglucosamine acyltransferase
MPIHPTAVIAETAKIHPSAVIGPYVVVDGNVAIGAETVLDPFVYVTGYTTIGAHCRLHSGAVVGDLPQDRGFNGAESYCQIGDHTILREGVTVHRGTAPGSRTTVGSRCMFLANSHVGHNCTVADGVTLVNGSMLGGYAAIGADAVISGNVAVHQFVRVGPLAMLGGLSKVTRDVPPYFMLDGDGICVGTNVVGMRRAGLSKEERNEVKEAFRILYRSEHLLAEAVRVVDRTMETPAGRRIADFLNQPSKRGLSMGLRSGDDSSDE